MNKRFNKYIISVFSKLFKDSYQELIKNDPLRMAGATAFFTTFALPPILIIIIQALSLIFNTGKISKKLFQDLSEIIGKESMQQVIETLIGFRKLAHNWYLTILGFLFLLFVATTLFLVIKRSLNQLWKIRPIKKQSFWTKMRGRINSIYIILIAGALFIIGILIDGLQEFAGTNILHLTNRQIEYFNFFLDYIYSIIAVAIWFTVLFRYLPDGRPTWKVAFSGAFVTSLLFNTGKLILHWFLTYKNIDSIYRASASIVLLLLFVFYSSLILYFGAAFTKLWAEYRNRPIRPLANAAHYRLAEVNEVFL